jgi:probable rRNA maturation factor
MNRIDIGWEGIEPLPWEGRAASFCEKALSLRGIDGWDLSLAFMDDGRMRDLNREYRSKDEPTDVLSFEMGERYVDPEAGERYLAGDVAISLDRLKANASEFGVGEDEELKRLILHGILHLGGMDHEDDSPERPMLALQETILEKLKEERIL